MARRYMSVSCPDGTEVRTFGGNGKDVRRMYSLYKNMTKEEFLSKHPRFKDNCEGMPFRLYVYYSGNEATCGIHIVDTKNKMCVVKHGFKNLFEAHLWALNNLPENEVHLWGQGWNSKEHFRYHVINAPFIVAR